MWSARFIGHAVRDRIHRHCIDRWSDRQLGIEAAGLHRPAELSLTGRFAHEAVEYFATPTVIFRFVLNSLHLDVRRFTFVDLGSGKGRILVLAGKLPFARVEGVELSSVLHQTAEINIATARSLGSLRAPVVSRLQDATEYELPPQPLILYLFNPFGRQVIAHVLDNVAQSLRDRPRDLYVVYVNAVHKDCFDRQPFLAPVVRPRWRMAVEQCICHWPIALYRARSPTIRPA
jgi:hypothetical protein